MVSQVLQSQQEDESDAAVLPNHRLAKQRHRVGQRSSSAPQIQRHKRRSAQHLSRLLLRSHRLADVQEASRRVQVRQENRLERLDLGSGVEMAAQILSGDCAVHLLPAADAAVGLLFRRELLDVAVRQHGALHVHTPHHMVN